MGHYDYKCRDTRECCFRKNGKCEALNRTYMFDGDCNFAKKRPEDRYSYNHLQRKRGMR